MYVLPGTILNPMVELVNAIEHQLQYRPGIAGSSVEHFNFEVIRYILYSPISVIVLRIYLPSQI